MTARRRAPSACRHTTGGPSDRGSAGLWLVAFAMVVFGAASAVVVEGVALAARHRAGNAADLSALAGAATLIDASGAGITSSSDIACRDADRIARANGARLIDCVVRDGIVEVVVVVTVRVGELSTEAVTAKARAGPG